MIIISVEIIIQPGLNILILPGQPQLRIYSGVPRRRPRRHHIRPPKGVVVRRPYHVARAVRRLQWDIEVIAMVVSDDIHAIAVLGLDEQHSGHEVTVGPWAILRCDRRCRAGADGLVCVDGDGLCGLGNQPFVGIQKVGAHSRGDGSPLLIAVLLFPDAPVHWVVAVARNGVSSAVLHFDQPVVAVVLVAGGLGAFGLLRAVAIGVVGVADGAAVRAGVLQQAMVLVVFPGPAVGAIDEASAIALGINHFDQVAAHVIPGLGFSAQRIDGFDHLAQCVIDVGADLTIGVGFTFELSACIVGFAAAGGVTAATAGVG